jgi:hypothetical protein
MIDADLSKAFVMEAIRRLVDDELAEWDRSTGGEVVLRLVTGEQFVLDDAGITCTQRPRRMSPMPSLHHRRWGVT